MLFQVRHPEISKPSHNCRWWQVLPCHWFWCLSFHPSFSSLLFPWHCLQLPPGVYLCILHSLNQKSSRCSFKRVWICSYWRKSQKTNIQCKLPALKGPTWTRFCDTPLTQCCSLVGAIIDHGHNLFFLLFTTAAASSRTNLGNHVIKIEYSHLGGFVQF